MVLASVEELRLKEILKLAIVEVFEEQQDLVREALSSAIEDMALTRAIDEGAAGPSVSRKEIFSVLETSH